MGTEGLVIPRPIYIQLEDIVPENLGLCGRGETAKVTSCRWCFDCSKKAWWRGSQPWDRTVSMAYCGFVTRWAGNKKGVLTSPCILIHLWNYSRALLLQIKHSECMVCSLFKMFSFLKIIFKLDFLHLSFSLFLALFFNFK